jgi:hypothetical protein
MQGHVALRNRGVRMNGKPFKGREPQARLAARFGFRLFRNNDGVEEMHDAVLSH